MSRKEGKITYQVLHPVLHVGRLEGIGYETAVPKRDPVGTSVFGPDFRYEKDP
jgi:hypothetical protein